MVLIDCNEAARAVTGGRIRGLLGITLSELYRDRPYYQERIWRCYHEQSMETEEGLYQYQTVDQALFLRTSYAFVPPDLVMIHTEDITEHVNAQEALQISLETARALLDAAGDAALLVDLEGMITALNAQAAERFGVPIRELVGTSVHAFAPAEIVENQRHLVAEAIRSGEPLEFEDAYWGHTFSHRLQPVRGPDGKVVSLAVYSRDVTERRAAENALRRYAQRLEVLHHIDHAIAAAQSPDEIARAALVHVQPLVPHDAASVRVIDLVTETWIELAGARGDARSAALERNPSPVTPVGDELSILSCRAVSSVADVNAQGPAAAAVIAAFGTPETRAYILAPLYSQNTLVGALFFGSATPDAYQDEHVEVVHEVADSLAIAIQNARLRGAAEARSVDLEALVAQRTGELETLYDITAFASESFDLQQTVDYALGRTLAAQGFQVGAVHVLDPPDGDRLVLLAGRNLGPDLAEPLARLIAHDLFRQPLLERGEPVAITDLASDPRSAMIAAAGCFGAWIAAPLRARGEVLGVLSLFCSKHERIQVEDVALASSIADHIGVAVQNAHLYRRAQQVATLEERERLARDLHDSVTQSLYSLTLLAQAGSNLVTHGRQDGLEAILADLQAGALGALREMRLMLHELRPAELATEGLLGVLRRRLDAVEGRVGIAAELTTDTPLLELPSVMEDELYRIAQEALNNALSHAGATEVRVHIAATATTIELSVTDNGCGFDPERVINSRGMGLATMRQRAAGLGGRLAVEARPNRGTTIRFIGDIRQPAEIKDLGEGSYG
jgi:PAS domain S-box-containing protein